MDLYLTLTLEKKGFLAYLRAFELKQTPFLWPHPLNCPLTAESERLHDINWSPTRRTQLTFLSWWYEYLRPSYVLVSRLKVLKREEQKVSTNGKCRPPLIDKFPGERGKGKRWFVACSRFTGFF